ncbi:MAG: hypothetical protein K9H64_13095 [Bacteroidales bacterium]|nr:hypothetical protein [Bacteroidales bacterium]MCF8456585.1 hypothetical protein [Bacteroidales bacterium]
MKRETLIETAKNLYAYNETAFEEYRSKKDKMVNLINKHFEERKDLALLIGEGNFDMMKDNHANHARFIESILKSYDHDVLTETVLWVFRAYRSHGFNTTYWAAQLNAWINILNSELSPESFQALLPIYEWMQVNIPVFNKLSE